MCCFLQSGRSSLGTDKMTTKSIVRIDGTQEEKSYEERISPMHSY